MNVKELKEKQENLSFFLSYLDISKISVLKKLKEENSKLDNIVKLKQTNIKFLNRLSSKWGFIAERIHEKGNEGKRLKNNSTLYILVDPKTIDKLSTQVLKKQKEQISTTISKNDFVVTFGYHVNLMAQELELNIIQDFAYDLFLNDKDFSELLTSITETGVKNNIFTEVKLLLTEFSLSRKKLTNIKIFPLNLEEKIKEIKTVEKDDDAAESDLDKNIPKSLIIYEQAFEKLDISKLKWEPNIDFFLDSFSKAITKQIIYETRTKVLIDQFKIELQLIEDKKNRLIEKLEDLKHKWNRIRKEEATTQSLLLHSAFKVREEDEPVPLFEANSKGEKV